MCADPDMINALNVKIETYKQPEERPDARHSKTELKNRIGRNDSIYPEYPDYMIKDPI